MSSGTPSPSSSLAPPGSIASGGPPVLIASTTTTPNAGPAATAPFTDLTAANLAFRQLEERSQRKIDSLTSRLDTVTSTLNALMLSQNNNGPAPNITGWPPASGFNPAIPPPGFTPSMGVRPPPDLQTISVPPFGASSQLPQPTTVPSPRVQSSSRLSFGPYQPGMSSSQAAAPLPSVATSTAGPGAQVATTQGTVVRSDVGAQSDGSRHSGSSRRPRGDAYDSEDDGDVRSSASGSRAPRRSRGRGPARLPPRQSRHDGSEEEDDPNDDYAVNRESLETQCKSLPIKLFNPEDKTQDFDIWVSQFEDAVNRGHNPHSKRRHHNYCLRWLPSYLNPDAYVVMRRCKNRNNWEDLKRELQAEYEDPTIRVEWRSNLRAYVWDESKESLTTYCSKVKRYVDTFETDIADVPQAKSNQYYIRFFSGLPTDYQKQIKMGTSSKKQNVDRALDVCLRYQSVKKEGNDKKLDVGAAVTFQDATVPSRVTQCETDIIRLKNRLGKYEQNQGNLSSGSGQYSNYRSPHRRSDYSRDSSMSSDSSQSRQYDRMNRFNAWKRGNQQRSSFRGRSPQSRFRSFRNQQQFSQQNQRAQSGQSSGPSSAQDSGDARQQVSSAASLEEGYALQSELDSEAEIMDDTICQFAADFEEREKEAFLAFCARKDEEDLCVPGNY